MARPPRYRVCLDRTSSEFEKKFGFPFGVDEFDKKQALQKVVSADVKYAFRPSKRYGITRYGKGTWPVLYAAGDLPTAVSEVAYHLRNSWLKDTDGNRNKRYRTSGRVAYVLQFDDSRFKKVPDHKKYLDAKKYKACHDFAERALLEGAHGLEAPSVRREKGRCFPVFYRPIIQLLRGLEVKFAIRWEIKQDELIHTADGRLQKFNLWKY